MKYTLFALCTLLFASTVLATAGVSGRSNIADYAGVIKAIAAQCGPNHEWLVAHPNGSLGLSPTWSSSLDHMFSVQSMAGKHRLESLEGSVSVYYEDTEIANLSCTFMAAPLSDVPTKIGQMQVPSGHGKRVNTPTWPALNDSIIPNGTLVVLYTWPYTTNPPTDGYYVAPSDGTDFFNGTVRAGMVVFSRSVYTRRRCNVWILESVWKDGGMWFKLRNYASTGLALNLYGANTGPSWYTILWPSPLIGGADNELFKIWSANAGLGTCSNILSSNCYLIFQFKHSQLFLTSRNPQTDNFPITQWDLNFMNGFQAFRAQISGPI
jgi:hypothetical protein